MTVSRRAFALITLVLSLFLVVHPTSNAWAQIPPHISSQSFAGNQSVVVTAVGVDGSGNVVVAGHFSGTADFGGGLRTSSGNLDVFLAKFEADGTHLWSQRFGDADEQEWAYLTVDGSDNIIITGGFAGTVDFGGDSLTSAGSWDIYVAKFDASGNHTWSRRFGDVYDQVSESVTADDSGNVIVVGEFEGTLDFGGMPLTSGDPNDIYVVKFDANGNHVWSERFGDMDFQYARGVAADDLGNVVVVGDFGGTVDFGGTPLTSGDPNDIYVAKFDVGGNHIWSHQYGGSSGGSVSGVATDVGRNISITGSSSGSVDFGGGPLTYGIYVAKLAPNGNHIWSRSYGAEGGHYSSHVAVDVSGNVSITGKFEGEVDFGGGSLTSPVWKDIYVAKLEANGNHVWSQSFGDNEEQAATSVAADDSGNVIIGGYFFGSVDFGGGPLTNGGESDGFVAKFGPGRSPTIRVDSRSTYPTPDGSTWATAYADLQDALAVAEAGDLIWVAVGTYKPTSGSDRTLSFELLDDVAIYGGFAGAETMLGERDWTTNLTVLSGDIGVAADSTDNSYHVVTADSSVSAAVMDGLLVTGGHADSDTLYYGGGLFNNGGSPTLANVTFSGNFAYVGGGMANLGGGHPTLTNVTFSENSGYMSGGMDNWDSDATLTDVTFTGNSAKDYGPLVATSGSVLGFPRVAVLADTVITVGGGMSNSQSSPSLSNVTFSGNSADLGGGMANRYYSYPTLTGGFFSGNSAESVGGGMFNYGGSDPVLTNVVFSENSGAFGGGMANDDGSPILTNVAFSGNSAYLGGGMFNYGGSDPVLTNVVFSENLADSGGAMYNLNSNPALINTIMWGDSAISGSNEIENNSSVPGISYSIIAGSGGSTAWDPSLGTDGGNNIDSDPFFKGTDFPTAPLSVWSSSPAVDAGEHWATEVSTDLAGNPRKFGQMDMGAYEHQGPATGIRDPDDVSPTVTALRSVYPNPFNPSVTVEFDLDRRRNVQLAIYDVGGRLVRSLVDEARGPGAHKVRWNGKDQAGNNVATGVYFFRLTAGSRTLTRKAVLLK